MAGVIIKPIGVGRAGNGVQVVAGGRIQDVAGGVYLVSGKAWDSVIL
jgi:hypothetical protein